MLEAFSLGVNAFMTFLGFVLMLFLALGIFTLIVSLFEMRKMNKPDEE